MRKIFFLLIFIPVLIGCANQKPFKDEFDSEKTWSELQVQLPAYPEVNNLISFDVGPTSNYEHYVDATTIQVGQDGVIRYSLVVKSPSGVMNVSYEGIRCATNERKIYALGRDDKTWSPPRTSDWQKLEYVVQYYAQRELANNFFCPHKQIVSSQEEAIRALKSGMHPRVFR